MGGGVLLDVGVHYIDVLRLWFGEPLWVWATQPPRITQRLEGENSILVVLGFKEAIADLHISWAGARSATAPHVEIIGERGALAFRFDRPYLCHTEHLATDHWANRVRRAVPWRIVKHLDSQLPRSKERRITVSAGDLIGSRALIEDFVLAISGRHASSTPAVEGLRDLRIVLAAYRAVETGAVVPVGDSEQL
jgi:predicted dehydrogenase